MIEVYILLQGNQYDGYEVYGVYNTREEAISAYTDASTYVGEHFRIEVWEVNGGIVSEEYLD